MLNNFMRTKSLEFFRRKPENFNCAQALLKGFQAACEVEEKTIESFRAYGGGRAEGGLCGAIFAAEYLRKQQNPPSENSSLVPAFTAKVQAITCRDIRTQKIHSCEDCVYFADELLNAALNLP